MQKISFWGIVSALLADKKGYRLLLSSHYISPGIPTTIKTMGVNITTIAYLRVLIIEMGSTIILMVVEAQGKRVFFNSSKNDMLMETANWSFGMGFVSADILGVSTLFWDEQNESSGLFFVMWFILSPKKNQGCY